MTQNPLSSLEKRKNTGLVKIPNGAAGKYNEKKLNLKILGSKAEEFKLYNQQINSNQYESLNKSTRVSQKKYDLKKAKQINTIQKCENNSLGYEDNDITSGYEKNF